MNVGIGNKAAQFLFWQYINQIFGTVYSTLCSNPLKWEEQMRHKVYFSSLSLDLMLIKKASSILTKKNNRNKYNPKCRRFPLSLIMLYHSKPVGVRVLIQRWAAQHVFQVRNTQFHSFVIVVRKTQLRSVSKFVSALCAMPQLRIILLPAITVGKNK
jgi:hypothetical protein